DHAYYTSKIYGPGDAASKELWVNSDGTWRVCAFPPSSYRQTERVTLSFGFPFYGHMLKEVTVAAGGFIYTGDVIHQMLTATQYIAPLMANFDPSLSESSNVLYSDNGTALVVQWNRLPLRDAIGVGTFTFQATLHSDGHIVFTYKEIPVVVTAISTETHPVKVGLADAFVVLHELEQIPDVRRRTIYEYHKVDIPKWRISNYTAVKIFPLPTCLQFTSCGSCFTSQIGFNCSWCSRLQSRCSSGIDRNRQDWGGPRLPGRGSRRFLRMHLPEKPLLMFVSLEKGSPVSPHRTADGTLTDAPDAAAAKGDPEEETAGERNQHHPIGLLAGVVMVTALMIAAVFTSVYIYHHPTSTISLFFIQRRPNRWPVLKY
uniref:Plexin domain containing 2a n=1 Tax=Tetraodon nigroviridis TaxID=99883 RepID=H3CJB2_TETNG